MHPAPQLRQQAGERCARAVLQRGGILALHRGIDFGGGHQAGTLFARLGEAETGADQFFGGRDAVERAVGLLDFGFLFLAEPAAFAVLQFVQQLGVELFIIHRRGAVDGAFHLHTDEAAAARKVGQQVAAVAGSDERGDAGQCLCRAYRRTAEARRTRKASICIRFFSWGIRLAGRRSNSSKLMSPYEANLFSAAVALVRSKLSVK